MGFGVESVFCASKNRKTEKMLRIELWTSDFDVKSGQNDPGTLIIVFALKNYAQKWSQIFKTLDG